MSPRSRVLGPLVTLLLVLAVAPAWSAPAPDRAPVPQPAPPVCDIDCPPPETYTHDATLTVTRSVGTVGTVGTVTSDTYDGHAINCGSTCSVTDSQVTEDPTFPDTGWHTYTLTASGGPSGYSAFWTDCDTGPIVGPTCSITNDASGGTAVSMTWVDTTAPTVTFHPPVKVGPSNYNVSAGATDNSGSIASYSWTVDGVLQAASGSVLSLAGHSHGSHSISVASRDAAGNFSPLAVRTVAVDKVTAVQVAAPPAYVTAPPAISFTKDADVVLTRCSVAALPGGSHAPQTCASGWQVPGPLADGLYQVRVSATDDVGNVATANQSFTLDTQAPSVVMVDGPVNGSSQSGPTAVFSFTATDPALDGVACTFDGQPLECSPGQPVEISDLASGTHTFSVTADDLAGNDTTVSRTFSRQRLTWGLTADDVTATYGQPVTLSAGFPESGATGTITFMQGPEPVCGPVEVTGPVVTCDLEPGLSAGTYDLHAAYSGDDHRVPEDAGFVLTVRKAATSLVARAKDRTVPRGKRAVLVAKGLPAGATGKVAFVRKGTTLCSARVAEGGGTCRTSARLKPGRYDVKAKYLGTADYAASSDAFSFRVLR